MANVMKVKNSILGLGLFSALLTGCTGPNYNTHFNEFSNVQSSVLNNNRIDWGFLEGHAYLNAANAGNYIVIMYNPKGSMGGHLEDRMKVQVIDQQGQSHTYMGVEKWEALPEKKHIEFARGLLENEDRSYTIGDTIYTYKAGNKYVLRKQDFGDIIRGKKAIFTFETSRGSHTVEYSYEKMGELRNFAQRCGL